jgi:ribonuclease G
LKFTQLSINTPVTGQPDFSSFTVETEIVKTGKINEVLGQKPNVLVQILKEPIAAKGPRLSCEISLPGRFVVITPFNDIIAVSRKIHSGEERKRLQKIIEAIKPKNFGVIVRTAAEGKNTAELHEDLNNLFAKWKAIQQNLSGAVAPAKILSEQTKTASIVRDLLSADFNKIVVDDKQLYLDTKAYIQKISPEKAEIVSLYSGSASVFDHTGVTKQVKGAFGKTVNLPSGAYLIIEHTEALHVIDVNSGYKSVSNNQEENALQTNLEAAEEIAMRIDRAKHAVLAISKFGLMQITRQRMKPEVNINTQEMCPSCQGTGKIASTLVLEDEIEKNISYLSEQKHKFLNISVHPILYAYLTKGIVSKRRKWAWKYKMNISVKENTGYHLTEFHFFDNNEEEIRL